mmetsp:Transcript_27333/g.54699  ORF Transcript_27333/g.54699 Transcript_27333/m.54699 type:complete len:414 (-) Transcript_27333:47-1288(-)
MSDNESYEYSSASDTENSALCGSSKRIKVASDTENAALILRVVPECLLKNILGLLPASHRFVSPVSRSFRDLYAAAVEDKKKNRTCKYTCNSEDALELYLQEGLRLGVGNNRTWHKSLIGAGSGRTDWIVREGGWREQLTHTAALFGQERTLRHLLRHGCPAYEGACENAAAGGHLGTLRVLAAAGVPWDYKTCRAAAECGHQKVLVYAREKGCPWNATGMCSYAARGGNLTLLKWVRGEGCPVDEVTCELAAKKGHIKMLKWASRDGFQWDDETTVALAKGGHRDVLEWTKEEGIPWSVTTSSLLATNCDLETFQWMRNQGCPWSQNTVIEAAYFENYELLKWLLENGCPYPEQFNNVNFGNWQKPKILEWRDTWFIHFKNGPLRHNPKNSRDDFSQESSNPHLDFLLGNSF